MPNLLIPCSGPGTRSIGYTKFHKALIRIGDCAVIDHIIDSFADIDKIYITASGGPFLNTKKNKFKNYPADEDTHVLSERSFFRKDGEKWFYVDGQTDIVDP